MFSTLVKFKYLISATFVARDHVSVVFAGGLVYAATTETAVVRHRATFGTAGKTEEKFEKKFRVSPNQPGFGTRATGRNLRCPDETGDRKKINERRGSIETIDTTTTTGLSLSRRAAVFRERGDQRARRQNAD